MHPRTPPAVLRRAPFVRGEGTAPLPLLPLSQYVSIIAIPLAIAVNNSLPSMRISYV